MGTMNLHSGSIRASGKGLFLPEPTGSASIICKSTVGLLVTRKREIYIARSRARRSPTLITSKSIPLARHDRCTDWSRYGCPFAMAPGRPIMPLPTRRRSDYKCRPRRRKRVILGYQGFLVPGESISVESGNHWRLIIDFPKNPTQHGLPSREKTVARKQGSWYNNVSTIDQPPT
ncbi:hypothetical protein AG1IA_09095 [Rhizoctonia solani AG-1 IA]|uniref:Uncharacterized protein n=1 Tax=Thanatephorus cucumeris (strain AG1-IA) TaxID=983506 RepID=L8WFZ7_THACA|nr:hypothetical protein AG1IA_09095 [Rhizoctonia solani AG-1 IA]